MSFEYDSFFQIEVAARMSAEITVQSTIQKPLWKSASSFCLQLNNSKSVKKKVV